MFKIIPLKLNYQDDFLDDGFTIEHENGDTFTCVGKGIIELLVGYLTERYYISSKHLEFFIRVPIDEEEINA